MYTWADVSQAQHDIRLCRFHWPLLQSPEINLCANDISLCIHSASAVTTSSTLYPKYHGRVSDFQTHEQNSLLTIRQPAFFLPLSSIPWKFFSPYCQPTSLHLRGWGFCSFLHYWHRCRCKGWKWRSISDSLWEATRTFPYPTPSWDTARTACPRLPRTGSSTPCTWSASRPAADYRQNPHLGAASTGLGRPQLLLFVLMEKTGLGHHHSTVI